MSRYIYIEVLIWEVKKCPHWRGVPLTGRPSSDRFYSIPIQHGEVKWFHPRKRENVGKIQKVNKLDLIDYQDDIKSTNGENLRSFD